MTDSAPVTGTSTGVFVSRELGQRGGPIYRVFYIVSQADGTTIFGGGLLDNDDFRITAHVCRVGRSATSGSSTRPSS
jgi:hypothetical protein